MKHIDDKIGYGELSSYHLQMVLSLFKCLGVTCATKLLAVVSAIDQAILQSAGKNRVNRGCFLPAATHCMDPTMRFLQYEI